jgi:ABC-type amino acid transport substrate-binding protein
MKRFISFLFLSAAFFLSCPMHARIVVANESSAACEETGEFQTVKSGVLTIGTCFFHPPFEYIKNGKKIGYEIELMNAVCKSLKIQCRFVETAWEGIIPRLENHAYDVIMGGIAITPERKDKINFSDPYMTTSLSLLIHFEINPEIRSIANLKGRSLAVQDDMADYLLVEAMLRKGEIGEIKRYSCDQLQEMVKDVQKGSVDAMLTIYPLADYIVENNKNLQIVQNIPDDPQALGIGLNKDNPRLLAAVNQVLKQMKADGSLSLISKKWFLY